MIFDSKISDEQLSHISRQIDVTSLKATKEILLKAERYLYKRKIKWNEMKTIGHGAYGYVYRINKNTIIKITEDRTEIHTMVIIRNNPHKNIVKVKDAFSVRVGRWRRDFIVEELLDVSDVSWKDFANRVIFKKHISQKDLKEFSNVNNAKNFSKDQIKWINDLALYFDKYGIRYGDLHEHNIMKRNKNHVLIDIGVAKCNKQRYMVL